MQYFNQNGKNWITKQEAADHLKISVKTIERWVTKGFIKSHRIGRRVLFEMTELDSMIMSK